MAISVAVTGPTGEIGLSAIAALERLPDVTRILGMARRPFDPAAHGWRKTEYRQGDILDRAAVDALVADADVVVHLAYVIMGTRSESRRVNLDGTRNVFAATVAAERPHRLVYTSSVAAYGYHADNPVPLTEDVAPRGSSEHYYSEQKAECEALLVEVTGGSDLEVYVLRPCIVAGPKATALADSMPWRQVGEKMPDALRRAIGRVPLVRPVLPDPGTPIQLVHQDDVAEAIALAASGTGPAGAYNLGADGTITISELATALGAIPVRVPRASAVALSATLARLPKVPAAAEWLHALRSSTVMDAGKAKRELGWAPRYTSAQTLDSMVEVR
ncbi:MAG: UDP-glucose 4-epimerase [Pseudonocardiales bacterium]|jgi:nucleoside-diphosphate-sugar epimerase|nr:UDP-glucose 4-epimerase [Pseudonocardiales bacterium]